MPRGALSPGTRMCTGGGGRRNLGYQTQRLWGATRARDELGDSDERFSWEDHTDTLASHLHPPPRFPTRKGDHRSFEECVWLDAAPMAESGSLRDLCKSSPALNFTGEDTRVQGRKDLFQGGVEWDLNLEPLVHTAGSPGAACSPHHVFPLKGVNASWGAGRFKAADTTDFIPGVWSLHP